MLDATRAVCVSTGLTTDLRSQVHESWRLNCERWRLKYFGPRYATRFMSPFLAPRILRWLLYSRKICAHLCQGNGMLGGAEWIQLTMQSKWKTSGNALLYGIFSVISSKLQ